MIYKIFASIAIVCVTCIAIAFPSRYEPVGGAFCLLSGWLLVLDCAAWAIYAIWSV